MKFYNILKITFIFFFFTNNLIGANSFFSEGKKFFEEKKLIKAKLKFEQDIVFNPKSEKSYLYLSKIFNLQKKTELEEENLNTVILLNPKNEEAVYNLAELKLNESDYFESQKLIDILLTFCKNYCEKSKKLKNEITNSQKK